jgi:hypothetical protein
MDDNKFVMHWHPGYSDRGKTFYENYQLVSVKAPGDVNHSKRSLKPRGERVCLFCGRREPEAKFATLSHLVPQLIGNGEMYSDFECDACNENFSYLENDLAEYLGVSRSFSGIAVPGSVRGFKGKGLRTKSLSFNGERILFVDPRDLNQDGHKHVISYTKNPFVPSRVFKALLKSALSVLPKADIQDNYQYALHYLAGRKDIQSGALINGYNLSFTTHLPLHILHFHKRNKDEKIHTDVVVFNFQNRLISVPIPAHRDDIEYGEDGSFSVVPPPPYFFNAETMASSMPVHFSTDLCSTEKVTDEQEHITVSVDPEALKNAVAINPGNGEVGPIQFGEDPTRYLVITQGDFAVRHPEEFYAFIQARIAELNPDSQSGPV